MWLSGRAPLGSVPSTKGTREKVARGLLPACPPSWWCHLPDHVSSCAPTEKGAVHQHRRPLLPAGPLPQPTLPPGLQHHRAGAAGLCAGIRWAQLLPQSSRLLGLTCLSFHHCYRKEEGGSRGQGGTGRGGTLPSAPGRPVCPAVRTQGWELCLLAISKEQRWRVKSSCPRPSPPHAGGRVPIDL